MSEATHTPGPWLRASDGTMVYALDENSEVNRFAVQMSGGYTIYTRRQRDAALNRTSQSELVANARLIAAAPDLLEAGQVVLSVFGNMTAPQHVIDALNNLATAIAKAQGATA